MNRFSSRIVTGRAMRLASLGLISAMAAAGIGISPATAGVFVFAGSSSDGHSVSGLADFTTNAGADTVTVKLINTTNLTLDAGELLTGLDFSLGGLVPSMTSATGIQRSVNGAGVHTDTLTAQNLSWSLVSLGGGNYQLNFNPNAKDAIIGPPNGGDFSAANGSIKNSPGHDPFAAEVATFVLSVPGLEDTTKAAAKAFRYGTELQLATGTIDPPPGSGIPEPSTMLLLALAAGGCFLGMRSRR